MVEQGESQARIAQHGVPVVLGARGGDLRTKLAVRHARELRDEAVEYVLGRLADRFVLADTLYRLTPNWQHFWVADALNGGGSVPWPYTAMAALYAAAWSTGLLGIGLLSFRNTDMR